ncbi:MAG: FAD-dependent oxidoreductase [Chloroflexota bacterium]
MRKNSDVVVIGGGINGVCTAFHLAQAGARVTLVEKNFIAGGPTGRSSAIIRQHYSNPVTACMALESLRVWQNFEEVVGGDAGFTQTGFIIAVSPKDIQGLKANIKLQQSIGIHTQFVSPEELPDLEPDVDVSGIGGAAYEPDSGYCDPDAAANSFAKAAKRMGADVLTDLKVTDIQTKGNKVIGVDTAKGPLSAENVVIAAGPWTSPLLQKLDLQIPTITARVKVGVYRRPEEFKKHCVWVDFATQMYFRPESGGLMLVGTVSPEEADDRVKDPDHFNENVSFDLLAEFAEQAAHRFPVMEKGYLANSYASLYDINPDWHHILDALPGYKGLYICSGSSGHGFKLGPAVGKMMAKLVLEGKQPGDDINIFSYDRFEKGKYVRGQYEYSIIG